MSAVFTMPRRFGKTPQGIALMRWDGPEGEEKFTLADRALYAELACMLVTEGAYRGTRELARRTGLGISAAYAFLHRLERSGLGKIERNDHGWILGIVLCDPGSARQARASDDQSARRGGRKRAPGWNEARAPVEPLLLESSKEKEIESKRRSDPIALAPPIPDPVPEAIPEPPVEVLRAAAAPAEADPDPAPPQIPDLDPAEVAQNLDTANDPRAADWPRRIARIWLIDHGLLSPWPRHPDYDAPRPRRTPGAPAANPSPAPAPARAAPAPLETVIGRVTNRANFPDQAAAIEDAARRLGEAMGEPFDLGPYYRDMADLVAERLTPRDVDYALKCSRGVGVVSRPAVYRDKIKKILKARGHLDATPAQENRPRGNFSQSAPGPA